ncbi:MAG TPA: nucleotidyltransferase domain-containing protein [bacterium]|nr:nucleotidyltransferase domain-containing protein [bacterium]
MRFGLKIEVIEQIQTVLRKYKQIEKAIVYGSRAKGNFRNGSDIDLTLVGKDLTLEIQYKIMEDLEELFLPYIIDLSIFHQISNPDLVDHIERVGIVFFER